MSILNLCLTLQIVRISMSKIYLGRQPISTSPQVMFETKNIVGRCQTFFFTPEKVRRKTFFVPMVSLCCLIEIPKKWVGLMNHSSSKRLQRFSEMSRSIMNPNFSPFFHYGSAAQLCNYFVGPNETLSHKNILTFDK